MIWFTLWEKEARVHLPLCALCLRTKSGYFAVAYNWTSRAILVREHGLFIVHQVLTSVNVLEVEYCLAHKFVSFLRVIPSPTFFIALYLPIIWLVTFTMTAESRHFLVTTQWGSVRTVRMQISVCRVVLKSDNITTLNRLPSLAHFPTSLWLFDCPDRIIAISFSYTCDNLLLASRSKVDVLGIEAKITRVKRHTYKYIDS